MLEGGVKDALPRKRVHLLFRIVPGCFAFLHLSRIDRPLTVVEGRVNDELNHYHVYFLDSIIVLTGKSQAEHEFKNY